MKVLEIRAPCTFGKYMSTGNASAKNVVVRTSVFCIIQLGLQPTFLSHTSSLPMQVCDIAAVTKADTPICWSFLRMAEVCGCV